jgi:hypothetical protein
MTLKIQDLAVIDLKYDYFYVFRCENQLLQRNDWCFTAIKFSKIRNSESKPYRIYIKLAVCLPFCMHETTEEPF